jgi:hypothetical protein
MAQLRTALIAGKHFLIMDISTVQRGLTSFRWFLASHAEELSGDLLWALGEKNENQDRGDEELAHRIRELNPEQLKQLCSVVQKVHRAYFGTMKARELSSFLNILARAKSAAQYG